MTVRNCWEFLMGIFARNSQYGISGNCLADSGGFAGISVSNCWEILENFF